VRFRRRLQTFDGLESGASIAIDRWCSLLRVDRRWRRGWVPHGMGLDAEGELQTGFRGRECWGRVQVVRAGGNGITGGAAVFERLV